MSEEIIALIDALKETIKWEVEDLKVEGYPLNLNKEIEIKKKECDEKIEKEEKKSKFLEKLHALKNLKDKINDCEKCGLSKSRQNIVFGDGNPFSDVVLVGEAPGAEEDIKGLPFVGTAGKYLEKILNAVQLKRHDVYICNIVKCRPPKNRTPFEEEVKNCLPYVEKQLEIIKPRFIITLGEVAATALLRVKEPVKNLRGKFFDYQGSKLIVTYHPAAILRNFDLRRPVWDDMKKFMEEYKKHQSEEKLCDTQI